MSRDPIAEMVASLVDQGVKTWRRATETARVAASPTPTANPTQTDPADNAVFGGEWRLNAWADHDASPAKGPDARITTRSRDDAERISGLLRADGYRVVMAFWAERWWHQ